MAKIINLRMARKAQARKDKQGTASANRAAFGETKAAKAARSAASGRITKALDGAKLERD